LTIEAHATFHHQFRLVCMIMSSVIGWGRWNGTHRKIKIWFEMVKMDNGSNVMEHRNVDSCKYLVLCEEEEMGFNGLDLKKSYLSCSRSMLIVLELQLVLWKMRRAMDLNG